MRASPPPRDARLEVNLDLGRPGGEGCTHSQNGRGAKFSIRPSQSHRNKSRDPRQPRTSFIASYASISAPARRQARSQLGPWKARGRGAPTVRTAEVQNSRLDPHNLIEPSRSIPDNLVQASLHHMRASQHARGQARSQLGAWEGRGEGCTHRRQRSKVLAQTITMSSNQVARPQTSSYKLACIICEHLRPRATPGSNSIWNLGGK